MSVVWGIFCRDVLGVMMKQYDPLLPWPTF